MIELKNVSCRFPGRVLFESVNLSIRRGEIVLLRGRSGCGKTTFLRILSAFLDPASGLLELDGKPYRAYRYAELRSKVVYLHQTPVLEPGKSVRENLLAPFSLGVHKGKSPPDEEKILSFLSAFHLDGGLLSRDARDLSVGEQQRAAIVRACLLQPDYLLLDEPIANLDPESARERQHGAERFCRERSLARQRGLRFESAEARDAPSGKRFDEPEAARAGRRRKDGDDQLRSSSNAAYEAVSPRSASSSSTASASGGTRLTPSFSAAPLPRFRSSWTTVAPASRARCAVSSDDPSSTTITEATSSIAVAARTVSAIEAAASYAGMTTTALMALGGTARRRSVGSGGCRSRPRVRRARQRASR